MTSALSPLVKKSMLRSHPWRWATALLVLVLAITLAWRALGSASEKPVFSTEAVKRGDIENLVTATGSLQPRDYVDVGAQVSGQLKKLHVDVGSKVKKGDLLAEIDATVYAAKVDGSRAQLANLKAQLLDREAQLQLAKIQYQRQQNLAKEDATTAESIQQAEASLKSAEAQLKALQAQIQSNESSLRVEAANLDYANIYAPMDGTVVTLDARQGQTLNTNQVAPTIMRVADLSTMTVKTQVSEADVSKLAMGMEVYFTTLGGQEQRWYSKLDSIQPTPEVVNNVVLYDALFDVPNPKGQLMTQMSTQVFFIVSQAKNALLVPMSAVSFMPRQRPDGADAGPGPGSGPGPESGAMGQRPEGAQPADRPAPAEGASSQQANKAPATKPGDAAPAGDNWSGKWREHAAPEQGEGATRPRPAMVKVLTAKGDIEERRVLVGVTSRVQAEILKGLEEGEQVVTGEHSKQAPKAQQPGGWGGPRMMR